MQDVSDKSLSVIFHPRSLALVSLVPRAWAIATAAHVQCSGIEVQWNTHTHTWAQPRYISDTWVDVAAWMPDGRRRKSKSNKYCIRLAIVKYLHTNALHTIKNDMGGAGCFLFFSLD